MFWLKPIQFLWPPPLWYYLFPKFNKYDISFETWVRPPPPSQIRLGTNLKKYLDPPFTVVLINTSITERSVIENTPKFVSIIGQLCSVIETPVRLEITTNCLIIRNSNLLVVHTKWYKNSLILSVFVPWSSSSNVV